MIEMNGTNFTGAANTIANFVMRATKSGERNYVEGDFEMIADGSKLCIFGETSSLAAAEDYAAQLAPTAKAAGWSVTIENTDPEDPSEGWMMRVGPAMKRNRRGVTSF